LNVEKGVWEQALKRGRNCDWLLGTEGEKKENKKKTEKTESPGLATPRKETPFPNHVQEKLCRDWGKGKLY